VAEQLRVRSDKRQDTGVRRICIGDIQGCAQPLRRLLMRVRPQPGDHIYCVGDLVNRGPDSLDVLRQLRAVDALVVLGNHDIHLLRVAAGVTAAGAQDRLDAVLDAPDCDELLEWLAAQPVLHVESDLVLVHAGLHPAWTELAALAPALNAAVAAHLAGEDDARIRFATHVRYCDAKGHRPRHDEPPPAPPFVPWDRHYRGARTVVFGHWARRGLVVQPRVRGLDTGCVYGGPLTAWIAEEDRLVCVPGWDGR